MRKKYAFHYFLLFVYSLTSCVVGFGLETDPYEKSSKELEGCLAGGAASFRVEKSKVLDFDSLVGGAGTTAPVCFYQMTCHISVADPAGRRGRFLCQFVEGNSKRRCQKLEECQKTMASASGRVFGFGEATTTLKQYNPKTSRKCRLIEDRGVVYSDLKNAKSASEYKALCNKEVHCDNTKTKSREKYPEMLCPTKGRDSKDVDICPGPDECYDTMIEPPSDEEYLKQVGLK